MSVDFGNFAQGSGPRTFNLSVLPPFSFPFPPFLFFFPLGSGTSWAIPSIKIGHWLCQSGLAFSLRWGLHSPLPFSFPFRRKKGLLIVSSSKGIGPFFCFFFLGVGFFFLFFFFFSSGPLTPRGRPIIGPGQAGRPSFPEVSPLFFFFF